MSSQEERIKYARRAHQKCARCGHPRWKHSKWAHPDSRKEVRAGGCKDVEDFQEKESK